MMRVLNAVVVLALLLSSGVAVPATALGEVTVSINAPAEVTSGGNFTATINITQVVNFDATNYDVSFNPAVLRLNNVTSGNIGGTSIPIDIWTETSVGTFTILQNVPGLSGVSGSGYLAVLHFSVLGSPGQSSNIGLSDGILSDILGDVAIPATWVGDSVNVRVDTTPPTVVATLPTTNATAAINTPIQVTFSESMNTTSAQSAFSISPTVSGDFTWAGNSMTFTPAANLNYSTLYTVTIGTTAKDLAGNSLAQAKIWSFTTGVFVEPRVTTPEPGVTTPEPGVTTPEPGVTTTEPGVTTTGPGTATTGPEVAAEKEELPPVTPEVGTTEALAAATAPAPPPPSASSQSVNWLVLGGIGGVVIVIGLFIFFQVSRRLY